MSIKKESWIRSDKEKKCPFGLPITIACQHAGNSVTYMCPLDAVETEEEKKKVEKANKRVYIWYKENQRCLYAHNIIESKDVVNCDYGDVGEGMKTPAFAGSPMYAQTFSGIGLDGLYAYPLGFYADNNESRNLFKGIISLVGSEVSEIIKNALDEEVLEKIENNKDLTNDEINKINSIIDKYMSR